MSGDDETGLRYFNKDSAKAGVQLKTLKYASSSAPQTQSAGQAVEKSSGVSVGPIQTATPSQGAAGKTDAVVTHGTRESVGHAQITRSAAGKNVFTYKQADGFFAIDESTAVPLKFSNGFFVSPKPKEGERPIEVPGATKVGKGEAVIWHIGPDQLNEAYKAALFKHNSDAAIKAYEIKDPSYRRTGDKLNLYIMGIDSKVSQGFYPVPLGVQIDTTNTNVHPETMNPIKSHRSGNQFVTISDPLCKASSGESHQHDYSGSFVGTCAKLTDGRTFDQIKNAEYKPGPYHIKEGLNYHPAGALLHPEKKGMIVGLTGGQEMEDHVLTSRLDSGGVEYAPDMRAFKVQEAENMLSRAQHYIGHIANIGANEKGITFKISPDNKEGDWFDGVKGGGTNFDKSKGAEFTYAPTLMFALGKRVKGDGNTKLTVCNSPINVN